ncbi:tail fiber protein [Chromobacterium sp. ASV23]|uniref:tail fiber protein n=1 Tax=Chromobacterium sp. ASV23 TaxID=2795110 RepID=UPI001E5C412F|nr:tail fiber protein [Chromobacterium sp. ASV23]
MTALPIPQKPGWPSITQYEVTERLLGGPGGPLNRAPSELLERTEFLKKQIDDIVSGALVAEYADRLKTARNIAMTGDGSWSVAFDGNGNVSGALTLANSGVSAGNYGMVTVDAKGRVTAGRQMQAADVPALDWSKIASGKPTTLAGYGITDAARSRDTVLTGTAHIERIASDVVITAQDGTNEGGQINFECAPQSTLNGHVGIDVWQNFLRIFETGGANRGVSIPIDELLPNIGTRLLTNHEEEICAGAVRAKKGPPNNADESRCGFAFENDGDTGLFAVGGAGSNTGTEELSLWVDKQPIFAARRLGLWHPVYGWLHEKFASKATTLAGYGIADAVAAADLAARGLFGRAANISAGSCLDIRPNGLYHVSEKAADRPVNSNGMLLANFLSAEWGALTYYAWGGATFEARLEGGMWKPWRQMGDANAVTAAAPPGQVAHFAMSTPPAGWVKCDGSLLLRTSYPALFAAIGTTFGAGDGKTTFGVPDLRGEFVRGWCDGRNVDAGRPFGSAQADMLIVHSHSYYTVGAAEGGIPTATPSAASKAMAPAQTNEAGGSETRPRNIALLACIKI